MHASSPHLLDVLGTVAGALGVSIAVFLQLVFPTLSNARVKPIYVAGFFAFGSVLLLLHTEFYIAPEQATLFMRLLGITLALLVEVAGAGVVMHRARRDAQVRDALGNLTDDLLP